MFEELLKILSVVDADYADARYEIRHDVTVSFDGNDLSLVSSNTTDGYVIRALVDGGMSSISFTERGDAEKATRTLLRNARLMAAHKRKRISLADVGILKSTFMPTLDEDPRNISIEEKIELLRGYNSIALDKKKVATTAIAYEEVIREKWFVSSEGSQVRQDLATTRILGEITANDGTVIGNVRVGIGGSNGFSTLRNREDHFENRAAVAVDLLKAESVKGGVYNCVLNPSMVGVLTHESFGHFSEADLVATSPTILSRMQIGAKLGSDILSIADDPTTPGSLGTYACDDEGVKARRVQLMKSGVLVGRLHSRSTAAEFGEPVTGHCIAEDYRFYPVVRMGTIFVEPGDSTMDDLLDLAGDGLYVLDAKGGSAAGETFTFGAQHGYVIRGGKIRNMVRDLNVSGNLYSTLANVAAVGNDFWLSEASTCGKGPILQSNIRSCNGGPHMLVKGLVVGGT